MDKCQSGSLVNPWLYPASSDEEPLLPQAGWLKEHLLTLLPMLGGQQRAEDVRVVPVHLDRL